ncbi:MULTISPECIES: hypothetical protein [unclassified Streptomyces]
MPPASTSPTAQAASREPTFSTAGDIADTTARTATPATRTSPHGINETL